MAVDKSQGKMLYIPTNKSQKILQMRKNKIPKYHLVKVVGQNRPYNILIRKATFYLSLKTL